MRNKNKIHVPDTVPAGDVRKLEKIAHVHGCATVTELVSAPPRGGRVDFDPRKADRN